MTSVHIIELLEHMKILTKSAITRYKLAIAFVW